MDENTPDIYDDAVTAPTAFGSGMRYEWATLEELVDLVAFQGGTDCDNDDMMRALRECADLDRLYTWA